VRPVDHLEGGRRWKDRVPTLAARGRPELLAQHPTREQVAGDAKIGRRDAVERDGEPHALEGPIAGESGHERLRTGGHRLRSSRASGGGIALDEREQDREQRSADLQRPAELEQQRRARGIVGCSRARPLRGRVVARDEDDQVARRAGNLGEQVHRPLHALRGPRLDALRDLLGHLQTEPRELVPKVRARTSGRFRAGGPRAVARQRSQVLPGALRGEVLARRERRRRRRDRVERSGRRAARREGEHQPE
jgi:hypothetical protein